MDLMTHIFGDLLHKDDQLTDWQMIARAFVLFLMTVALVRLAGRRSFGMRSPFDTVISLLLGATLSRGIVGASSFVGILGASITLALLHRILAYATIHSPLVSRLIGGKNEMLYQDGRFNADTMEKMLVTERDLLEAIRLNGNKDSYDSVKSISIERSGEISVVKKEKKN